MKRSKPLKRHDWMRRRKRRPKSGDDPRYLEAVRGLPCVLRGYPGHECSDPVSEPHHAGWKARDGGGASKKAPDRTAIPACRQAHMELERKTRGPFWEYGKEQMRDLLDSLILKTQLMIGEGP